MDWWKAVAFLYWGLATAPAVLAEILYEDWLLEQEAKWAALYDEWDASDESE